MRLRNKIAIVTGGANGIGQATAELFASEGASVVVADRDTRAGIECQDAIRSGGGNAVFLQTDVSRDSDVAELIDRTLDLYGGINVLINCAGVDIVGSVVDTEPERWQRVLDVNLASVYRTCRFTIPHLIRRGGGSIVNVASLQGMYGWPHYAAYAASKAGIIGLTRQVAVDYADENIRVNAISPGGVATRLLENSVRLEPAFAGEPKATRPTTDSAASQPRSREGTRPRLRGPARPEDVAYAALYLASDESAHVSGHNLVVDGGASTRVG